MDYKTIRYSVLRHRQTGKQEYVATVLQCTITLYARAAGWTFLSCRRTRAGICGGKSGEDRSGLKGKRPTKFSGQWRWLLGCGAWEIFFFFFLTLVTWTMISFCLVSIYVTPVESGTSLAWATHPYNIILRGGYTHAQRMQAAEAVCCRVIIARTDLQSRHSSH